MHLIQSLKNEVCFDLPLFLKYPATSINSDFNKMTLVEKIAETFLAHFHQDRLYNELNFVFLLT